MLHTLMEEAEVYPTFLDFTKITKLELPEGGKTKDVKNSKIFSTVNILEQNILRNITITLLHYIDIDNPTAAQQTHN
jgi:hypothetical protein